MGEKSTEMSVVPFDDDEKKSEVQVEDDVADPWALVEPPRTGKAWSGVYTSLLTTNHLTTRVTSQ